MDTKHLLTFITLSQTLNYQKAASRLKYAPSTLFKHIQLLEQELGVPLLVKSGRQLQLTEAGEMFKGHAERILTDYHRAIDSLVPEKELTGNIMIGGCEMNTANCLLESFMSFSQRCPKTRMSMTTSPNSAVPAMVKKGLADVGFYFDLRQSNDDELQTIYLYQEPIFLMASKKNPLIQKGTLHYEDLDGIDFVFPHDDCCFVVEMLSRLHKRGIRIGNVTYLGGVQLVVEQAHKDKALMLVPYSAVRRFHNTYNMVRLNMDEEPVRAWECILYRNYDLLKPAAKSLIRHSLKCAKEAVSSDSEKYYRSPEKTAYSDIK